MDFPLIKTDKKILVVSPLNNKIEKINELKKISEKYIVVFTGEICHPFEPISEIEKRIEIIDSYLASTSSFYVVGDGDLTFKSKNKFNDNKINAWIENQCLGINIIFNNNTQLTVVHGGIPLQAKTWKDIISNLEIAFVKKINDKPWHQTYDGRFGYVISAHTMSDKVEIYNFSASIDVENKICFQEFSESGLGQTILI